MAEQPVFFDPSGRRRRRFGLAVAAFVALILLAVAIFVVSIGAVPRAPLLPIESEQPALRGLPPPHGGFLRRTRRGIDWYARQLFGKSPAGSGASDEALAVAFHTPWDPSSAASLQRHINQLDWVVPGWVSVTGPTHQLTFFRDAAGRAIINHASRRPLVLPMVQNALQGDFDSAGIARLLSDPRARKALLDQLVPWLQANGASGACFDFEELPASAQSGYLAFLREAKGRFAPRGWALTVAAPVNDPSWNLPAYAQVVDRLFLMSYDEHENSGPAGPIASARWFAQVVANAARGIPKNKLIVAFGNYGYDWHDGRGEPLSVEEAWEHAVDSNVKPTFDPASGNDGFAYTEGNSRHVIWLLDAASAYNELHFLQRAGVKATALWRLGAEDPGLWRIWGRDHRPLPPVGALADVPNGTDVDIEGPGEILKIVSVPQHGLAHATAAPDGSLAVFGYDRLPTPYEVDRFGYRPKQVALTFDDGPDADWTPRILDVLKAKHVPATFFVIGENALTNHGLLNREVAEGHEVGSHTYTHPNLADASDREVGFELNTTQRLFQAFTGRTLKLFRPPYFGDAEPSTADEIGPALLAQNRGYITVGLHVDPGDWKRPGVQQIIDATLRGVRLGYQAPGVSHNIVLLHDAGGDRSQTLAALPVIIDQLRAEGYTFVPVSVLAGLPAGRAMPPISSSDRAAAAIDFGLFTLLGDIVIGLGYLFVFAITIGILRAVALSALALVQARREGREVFPDIDPSTFVTVMIPAFNEERVIERAVRGVLASRDVQVEVIVVDDGSADGTSEVVRNAFGDEPRVKLLTLQNGGKARALNRGLELASSPIVIALDADTQFEPATIARLARWFVDPDLGAVAGNAKVGNRVNLVTRWQALEYITAQNLERRALARLNAMTVVPGAIGAWRLDAIRSVGGYPDDTLAEDQDLTIAIQRAGWKVRYDQFAVAWTEAPETFRGLAKQRFRWAYGTLQCLWKHRAIIWSGRPRGLAAIGLPQAILFQIVLAAISPIIDLALIVSFVITYLQIEEHGIAQNEATLERMLGFWIVFTAIDLLAATIAFALERRERWRLLLLLVPQRVGYRQVMYYVVLKAITQALRGPKVGWGKLQRTGRVETASVGQ